MLMTYIHLQEQISANVRAGIDDEALMDALIWHFLQELLVLLKYIPTYQLRRMPPRYPDLNTLDFFWGYLKNLVYKTPINILEGLVKKIVVSCKTLRNTQGLFERVCNSMRIRGEAWLLIIESRNFQPFKNNINFGLITSLNRCNRSSFIHTIYIITFYSTIRFSHRRTAPIVFKSTTDTHLFRSISATSCGALFSQSRGPVY